MKERDIISTILNSDMPDIERVRQNCISQSLPKKLHTFKIVVITAVLVVVTGTTALAAANREAIILYFESVPNRASHSEHWDYYQALEEMEEMPDVFLNETVREKVNYIGSQHIVEFSNYDEIRDLFDVYIGNDIMDTTEFVSSYTYEYNDNGEYVLVVESTPDLGVLVVDAKGNEPESAVITSSFVFNDATFRVVIYIPLNTEYDHNKLFNDGFIENRYSLEEFFYTSTANGIDGRILIAEETGNHGLGMNIQLIYNGVFYQIDKISSFGITEGTPLETAEIIINAFR